MELKEIILRKTIPVVINSFNQKFYLKNLIEKLVVNKFKNIYVIDNKSESKELLKYYKSLDKNLNVMILYYGSNLGPRNFHINGYGEILGNLPHIYTDPDMDFDFLAENYVSELIKLSHKYRICKIGSALEIPCEESIKINLKLKIIKR